MKKIILKDATLLAGTSTKPYTKNLKFMFYGQNNETQIPFYTNKGISCFNCKIIIHGV